MTNIKSGKYSRELKPNFDGKVLFNNILVMKETNKTYTFYNIGELYDELGCYLERYFYKDKLDLKKFKFALEQNLTESEEFFNKIYPFTQRPLVQFERPADYHLRKLLDKIRDDLGLEKNSLKQRVEILNEIPMEINDFSGGDFFSEAPNIDFKTVFKNEDVDYAIRAKYEEMVRSGGLIGELEDINKIENKQERIKQKKSI